MDLLYLYVVFNVGSAARRMARRGGIALAMCSQDVYNVAECQWKSFMPTKITVISFRAPADMKDALERISEQDNRSISSLVEMVLADWLRHGGQPPRKAPAKKQARRQPPKR
jgi:hypothetical protein